MSARECPRCGYDLSGEIGSWGDVSPVFGVCSECGLRFAWGEVLHPTRSVPRWSVEHPQGFTLRRAGQTFVRTFWPWSLWGKVAMAQPMMSGRLALFAAFTYVVMHVLTGVTAAAVRYVSVAGFNRGALVPEAAVSAAVFFIWPYGDPTNGFGSSHDGLLLAVPLLAVALVLPASFLCLGTTMARARVRETHLVRALVLTLPIPAMGFVVAMSVFNGSAAGWPGMDPSLGLLAVGCAMVIHAAAWWVVVSRYLKLEQPAAVSAAMTTIAWLSGLTALVWADRWFWYWL